MGGGDGASCDVKEWTCFFSGAVVWKYNKNLQSFGAAAISAFSLTCLSAYKSACHPGVLCVVTLLRTTDLEDRDSHENATAGGVGGASLISALLFANHFLIQGHGCQATTKDSGHCTCCTSTSGLDMDFLSSPERTQLSRRGCLVAFTKRQCCERRQLRSCHQQTEELFRASCTGRSRHGRELRI